MITMPLTAEQREWAIKHSKESGFLFLEEVGRAPAAPPGEEIFEIRIEPNPCVRLFGKGPEGVTCKHCKHLIRKQYARLYLKCFFRGNTNGAATDHKAGWQACKRFEEDV